MNQVSYALWAYLSFVYQIMYVLTPYPLITTILALICSYIPKNRSHDHFFGIKNDKANFLHLPRPLMCYNIQFTISFYRFKLFWSRRNCLIPIVAGVWHLLITPNLNNPLFKPTKAYFFVNFFQILCGYMCLYMI